MAVMCDAEDTHRAQGEFLTKEDWNQTGSLNYQPYTPKVLAKTKAWVIAGSQNQ
jgi:hypothetical protein